MEKHSSIQELVFELYSHLAATFPVCCASDEFVFFPQAIGPVEGKYHWDDLSPEAVKESVYHLREFQRLAAILQSTANQKDQPLTSLLIWVARTLEEQFTIVRTHATQPTFALSVATVGLIQALQSENKRAWTMRLQGLPLFLDRAFESLSDVPELYRDHGVEMANGISRWLQCFESDSFIDCAGEAVVSYAARLSRLPVRKVWRLEEDLLERVVGEHTGSGLTIKEALGVLEDEITTVKGKLCAESGKLGHGSNWRSAFLSIPSDSIPEGGKKELLKLEINRLRDHCRSFGFMELRQEERGKLRIEYLPSSLDSIRATDSYNAAPGHPFQGGVFYIYGGGSLGTSSDSVHPVYRMTAAHETYPGHHLLDLCRWNHPEAALRPIEYPLFYEGWACYGEELMRDTGALDRPCDSLILLWRRLRHAVRGKVDLLLHSGKMEWPEAAEELVSVGFSSERALGTVQKYALRPAYQMCYTVGHRYFQRLYNSYGQGDVTNFVNSVLSCGELLFEDLERIIMQKMGNGETGKPLD